jgi:NAD(P)-dependent dehydrogenase (short-subunit alcohol dehydrogenase family)
VDLADPASILEMYRTVGEVDAVVSTAGVAAFGAVEEVDDAAWASSLENKLMGQVRLVRVGLDQLTEGASFTLTTGTLSQRPTPGTVAVATVGGALESFVRAAALDVEGRYRINVVSPGWVAESRQAMGLEPMPGIWARDLAAYYVHCVESTVTGEVLEAEAPMARG